MGSGGPRGLQNRWPQRMRREVRFLPLPQMEPVKLSSLPQIEKLMSHDRLLPWVSKISRPLLVESARRVVDRVRKDMQSGDISPPSMTELIEMVETVCTRYWSRRIRRVINATGTLLHTNMGRSPIPSESWDSARGINTGYSNLEFDLTSGKRGKRNGLIPDLLSLLVGSEAACIVNNNAAAVYLILSAFANGREVIVSRGEQVQIGGGFRIPEILRASGARLKEVGTTNITSLNDYAEAITENSAMILHVHRSNFALRGFSRSPSTSELSGICTPGMLLCVDQGSGVTTESIPGETTVKKHLRDGAHLVSFSGDKVLGGPQAGCIVGKKEYIEKLQHHPLMRVFRPGKTIYSLLEDLLIQRLNGSPSFAGKMLETDLETLKKRGRRILYRIDRDFARIINSTITTGGGSAPDEEFPSLSIQLSLPIQADEAARLLRDLPVPVIGTISEDAVLLNLAAVDEQDIPYLRESIASLIESSAGKV